MNGDRDVTPNPNYFAEKLLAESAVDTHSAVPFAVDTHSAVASAGAFVVETVDAVAAESAADTRFAVAFAVDTHYFVDVLGKNLALKLVLGQERVEVEHQADTTVNRMIPCYLSLSQTSLVLRHQLQYLRHKQRYRQLARSPRPMRCQIH